MVSDPPRKPNPGSANIVFAGSPEFAIPSLRALVESGHTVPGVLTQPDRPAGRGRTLRPSPIKAFAEEQGLDVLQPETLHDAGIREQLAALSPDVMVIVAYGQLLPATVLDIPAAGCVNVHASVLPRWRGASPVHAAILAGDPTTGASIMRMDAGLDTGPVYATKTLEIGATETTGELEARLAESGAALLVETLPGILDGTATAHKQDEAAATYAARINKSDAQIDWNAPAIKIDRQIRAYNPWPVAYTMLDEQRMRCWSAVPLGRPGATPAAEPGAVIAVDAAGIDVQTGHGVLRIRELQMPGRQRMRAVDFANGYPVLDKRLGPQQ